MRVAGKTHCHPQVRPAFGYLRRSAPGSSTQPAPCRRSPSCCRCTRSKWALSSAFTEAGNMVARSLCPLPSRMVSWFVAKSTSFTRRRQHSNRRRPAPVQQDRHEPRHAIEVLEDSPDLLACQHHGQVNGPLGPDDVVEPRQFDAQHLAIEKEQGAQGLVLRGGGDLTLNGE